MDCSLPPPWVISLCSTLQFESLSTSMFQRKQIIGVGIQNGEPNFKSPALASSTRSTHHNPQMKPMENIVTTREVGDWSNNLRQTVFATVCLFQDMCSQKLSMQISDPCNHTMDFVLPFFIKK